jgi:hypothetical protein
MMGGTRGGRSAAGWSRWFAAGTAAAYAAAFAAFSYAMVSAYWAVGGRGLVSTVGGYAEQVARRGGTAAVLIALAATVAKVAGGVLALALVRPCGRVVPRAWLLAGAAGASLLLIGYGGLNVLAGTLVLSGAIHPSGSVDKTALRWHVGVWDMWFLIWGILLGLAASGYRRRTANRATSPHRCESTKAGKTYPFAAMIVLVVRVARIVRLAEAVEQLSCPRAPLGNEVLPGRGLPDVPIAHHVLSSKDVSDTEGNCGRPAPRCRCAQPRWLRLMHPCGKPTG